MIHIAMASPLADNFRVDVPGIAFQHVAAMAQTLKLDIESSTQ